MISFPPPATAILWLGNLDNFRKKVQKSVICKNIEFKTIHSSPFILLQQLLRRLLFPQLADEGLDRMSLAGNKCHVPPILFFPPFVTLEPEQITV